jgi:hypothetical protein
MTNNTYPPKVSNWLRLIEQGKVKGNTLRIINFIHSQSFRGTTVYDMRVCLGMAHQTLTGCLSNIMDEGLVKIDGIVDREGNSYSVLFIELNPSEMLRLKKNRHNAKFNDWVERGIKDFSDEIPPALIRQLRDSIKYQLEFVF